jgi:hypothetical protein
LSISTPECLHILVNSKSALGPGTEELKNLNSLSIFCEIVKKFKKNPNPKLKSAAVKSIHIENDSLFVSHSVTDCQGESKKLSEKKYIESFALNDRDNDDKEQ